MEHQFSCPVCLGPTEDYDNVCDTCLGYEDEENAEYDKAHEIAVVSEYRSQLL